MKRRILALGSLAAFVVLAAVGPFGSSVSIAIPGRGTLVGTDGSGGNLIAVRMTGVGTVIGNMGASIPALATDPRTRTLYAGSGAGSADVFTVNRSTAGLTFVGSTGLGFAAIGGMDFSPGGVLVASVNIAGDGGTGSDHLARINKSTGAATVIGPFGQCTGVTVPSDGGGSCSIEGMEAIAFDNHGRLWGALSERGAAGRPGLYSISTSTGRARFLRRIKEVSSGVEPSGGVVSLQFACGGGLLGGTATAIPPADDGGRLIRIDREDGDFRFVGTTSATGGSSLAALAFLGACP